MAKYNGLLKIVLIDDDPPLVSDAEKLDRLGIAFSRVALSQASAARPMLAACDAIIVAVDSPGALTLLVDLCGRQGAPPVIALAGPGPRGVSLEHILTLAEMRGAALALPKPIDAIELALAALKVIGPRPGIEALAKELGRRLAS